MVNKVEEKNLDKEIQEEEVNQEDIPIRDGDVEGKEKVTSNGSKEEETEEPIEEVKSDKEEKEKSQKSFFKREKKDKKDEKIEELNDRLVRTIAEFDNFRKRNEKEKTQMFEIGAQSIVEKVLPIIDNFERGLATVSDEDKNNGFVKGMEQVYKQLLTSLEEAGVKPIEALGKEFDPNLHNAVMHDQDPEQGDNLIVEEFQKGYMYKEHVVRYSMVKVVN